MKRILCLLFVAILFSCNETEETESCQDGCWVIEIIEPNNRIYSGGRWRYNYKFHIAEDCTGEREIVSSKYYSSSPDEQKGDIICDLSQLR